MRIGLLSNRRGLTLAEMSISLGIVTLAIFGMTSILVHSSRASSSTTTKTDLDSSVALAAEKVEGYLIEARVIAIDADGMGLTYRYPPKNGDGTYSTNPGATDNVNRRLYVANGELYSSAQPDRPILTEIPDVDPDTGEAIEVFKVGTSSREVEVRLVSEGTTSRGCCKVSAVTTRIRPRNAAQQP